MTKPKKCLLIGVDQAIPYLIDKFVEEGIVPNIKNLIDNGVKGEASSCPPCDSPTNWTTIATGAKTAVHGATSFYMHKPGEALDYGLKIRSRSSLSKHCGAEYFWDVADKEGLKCFILNYPGGWPGNLKNGEISLLTWPLPESNSPELIMKTKQKYNRSSSKPSLKIAEVRDPDRISAQFKSHSPILQISIQIPHHSIKEFPKVSAYILDTE